MPKRGCRVVLICAAICGLVTASATAGNEMRDALWAAVRAGDAEALRVALDRGAEVNAKNEMGVSALWIAASKGKLDVIQLLVERGADVNVRDGIWYQTPLRLAVGSSHLEVAQFLIKSGAKDGDEALFTAASLKNEAMVQMIIEHGKVGQDALDAALYIAGVGAKEKLQEALKKAGAHPLPPATESDRKMWEKLAGTYESDGGFPMVISLKEVGLIYADHWLKPAGRDEFVPLGSEGMRLRVEYRGEEVARIVLTRFTNEYSFFRFIEPVPSSTAAPPGAVIKEVANPINWPSFRGPGGTGVADGQLPPVSWDVKTNKNVRWKTPIPGLGHSCPVVWGNRVFVTTAISGEADPKIRIGNYGDVESVDDKTSHTWQLLCLDRDTGKILWTRTAYEGVPKIKRHLKGSQANCTPATDGKHVIACFGSEGLYCYDFAGKLLWKRDLSTLDSSFAIDEEYEWGFGNSPVIHEGLVILQCDLSRDSFMAAFSLDDGAKVWSTPRDEIPSWSSPVIWHNTKRTEIVTNAAQYARGYDPAHWYGTVAASQEVGNNHPDAGMRQGLRLHYQRQPADPADLRNPPGRDGRHLLKGRRRAQRIHRLEQTARRAVHAHADPLRAVLLYLFQRRHRCLLRCGDRKGDLQEAYWRRELHLLAGCGGWATLLHLRAGRNPRCESRTGNGTAGGEPAGRLRHGHARDIQRHPACAKSTLPVRIGREDGWEKVMATAGAV